MALVNFCRRSKAASNEKDPTDWLYDIEVSGDREASNTSGIPLGSALLSWFIVLWRQQKDESFSFQWDIVGEAECLQCSNPVKNISNDLLSIATPLTIGQALKSVNRHVDNVKLNLSAVTCDTTSVWIRCRYKHIPCMLYQQSDSAEFGITLTCRNAQLRIAPAAAGVDVHNVAQTRLVEDFVHILKVCISHRETPLIDVIRPSTRDLDTIWQYNAQLPIRHSCCIHELISEQANKTPDSVAVCSWDGELTYKAIEDFSSILAQRIKDNNILSGQVVGICFEKSCWATIAVLAVMKAGNTFVLMDPSLPLARLQNMAEQVETTYILSSSSQRPLAAKIVGKNNIITVGQDTLDINLVHKPLPRLDTVNPETLMYIIFTSGSTGTPKGVKISHSTYTSSAIPRARAVGYTSKSRVLDFAAYAFDVSIDSMLLTLSNGGCLCIPSDQERMDDINEAMRRLRVTYAGLTPSVARILDNEVITSLDALGLGGEAVSARDVNFWGQQTRIVIGYGPCECTIGCTINGSAAEGRDYVSIGKGNGAAIWVVDPDDHNNLVPVGAVGELLVEGPIVGQGYLNDPEKTASSFIEDPPWLLAGHGQYPGRKGRLYKSGDLVRHDPYNLDEFVFVGRKDTQVKLRGQRVELGEIENQLRSRLGKSFVVVVEVVRSAKGNSQATLVAFIGRKSSANVFLDSVPILKQDPETRKLFSEANSDLAGVLPRYMIPTAYILLEKIPILVSGKIDRKLLRQLGAETNLQEPEDDLEHDESAQLSQPEQDLRTQWASCLGLDPSQIKHTSNFFALGGDSLAAMRLVSTCRASRIQLSVSDVFENPTLDFMSTKILPLTSTTEQTIEPFSLLRCDASSLREDAARVCGNNPSEIADVYPCTATQESLFTFSLKSANPYLAQRIARVPKNISSQSWKQAWEAVHDALPILRTRLAQLLPSGLQQVVVRNAIEWRYATSLKAYIEQDKGEEMGFGQPLARYALITDQGSESRYMVWTIHHVVYDGWSEPLVLDMVRQKLAGELETPQSYMAHFVRHLQTDDVVEAANFWRKRLDSAFGSHFPPLPSRDWMPLPDVTIEHKVQLRKRTGLKCTLATMLRGAWALLASYHADSDDVVFGETFTGRDVSVQGVDEIIGPLNATIPIRVHVDKTSTVETYLESVQQSVMECKPYQHVGWQNIRKVSEDAQRACETGTGIILQLEPHDSGNPLGFEPIDVVQEAIHFNPYPLMLAFGTSSDGFRVRANFDSRILSEERMQAILHQLEIVVRAFDADQSAILGEVPVIDEEDLSKIWKYNKTGPINFDPSRGAFSAAESTPSGAAYPPLMVAWVCSKQTETVLVPLECVGELWLESRLQLGNGVVAPAWLDAGCSNIVGRRGFIHATGDLVKLTREGTLKFVRRKGAKSSERPTPNLDDLDKIISSHLLDNDAAAVFVPCDASSADIPSQDNVVVLVQQDDAVAPSSCRIMSSDYVSNYNSDELGQIHIKVSSRLSHEVVAALHSLDRAIKETLPHFLVPTTYLVVDIPSIPLRGNDRRSLGNLISSVPTHVYNQSRHGLRSAWSRRIAEAQVSSAERVVRSAWASVLHTSTDKIDLSDNFFRLGGDSVLAMKLVSHVRKSGYSLTVAQIFRNMRLKDMAAVVTPLQSSEVDRSQYVPFSTVATLGTTEVLIGEVRTVLAEPDWSVQDIYPVTSAQKADVYATIHAPRTAIQYTMLLSDKVLDVDRLRAACERLVAQHEVLRSVFVEIRSQLLQVVMSKLETPIEVQQATDDVVAEVKDWCTQDAQSDISLGRSWLRFHCITSPSRDSTCLIIRLSHAQYDGVSLPRLLRDIEALYREAEVAPFRPFSSFTASALADPAKTKAIEFWSKQLKHSNLALLSDHKSANDKRSICLTQAVTDCQRPEGITIATLLTTAWATVLARHLKVLDVVFGNVASGRLIDGEDMTDVVGPCYQICPVRVRFDPALTVLELLRSVQLEQAEAAGHAFLNFDTIVAKCTDWPEGTQAFDSMVHHQDWEDFESMPFGDGTCKVDVLNPFSDAAYPLKAVSFVKEGKVHVGVVGYEEAKDYVKSRLEDLVRVMERLSMTGEERVQTLLD